MGFSQTIEADCNGIWGGAAFYDNFGNCVDYNIPDINLTNKDIPDFPSDRDGEVIHIPDDYPTIQEGIDASVDGDSILVSAGTYYENLIIDNKAIILFGEGSENTIIDGSQNGSVIHISSSLVHIDGFTVMNGSGYLGYLEIYGGGMYVNSSNLILSNILIKEEPLYSQVSCHRHLSYLDLCIMFSNKY